MTIESKRPNFYILLDLRPSDKWDQAKFELALRNKRIEWSRQGSSTSKKALVAKQNLALIPEIEHVMKDAALRDAEAKAAEVELASGRKAELERFERDLRLLNDKEYLEQGELDTFKKEFSAILSEKEITERIKVPVKPSTPATTTATAPQLDPTIAREIEQNLALIGCADLYALLGRSDATSDAEMYRAAEQLYNEMVSRQPKTAEVTVKSTLAGHARTIFKSKEERKRYDETLRQRTLNALLKDVERSVNRSTTKEVHERQVQTFLLEARKAGWDEEVARAKFKEYARDRKWVTQMPAVNTGPTGPRCGNCHEINEVGSAFCRTCKKELLTTCPNCGGKVATDDPGCSRCGFPVGNRYLVDSLLEQVNISRDPVQIRKLLNEVEELWKPKTPDARVKKFSEIKTTLQKRSQEQQRTLEELLHFIDQHQFYAAQRFLLSNANNIPDQQRHSQEIERSIGEAQALLKQAQVGSVGREKRIELCQQALHTCADYKAARDFLSTLPPPPPENLQASVSGPVVHLSWKPSPISGVVYRVVRKNHARPNAANDGKLLATVSGQIYDDEQPEIGVPLYYAIFSELEKVTSHDGAVLAKPLLLTQDVEDVTVAVDHQKVRLSWKAPVHAHNVVIIRKERVRPQTMQDGTLLATCDRSQTEFSDRNVQNGHIYYYGIYCQYKNAEGHLISSPGRIERASPETPPAFITQLDITEVEMQSDRELRIRWQPPTKGTAVVVKSDHPLTQYECSVIDKSQIGRLGQKLEDLPDMVTDASIGSLVVYYTPVVIFQNSLYVGKSHRYTHVDNVTQLSAQNLGTAIRLKWRWPEHCQEVAISFSLGDWPRPDDAAVTTSRVRREEYERLGYYDLKGMPGSDHYILVCAVIMQGNESIAAQGVRIKTRLALKLVMTYEIKKPTLLNRHYTLHISTRAPGSLPAMVLIGKRGSLPFKRTDGMELQRIEPKRIDNKKLVIEVTTLTFPQGTCGKLFLEDDSMYAFVDVHHPGEEMLRLY
jgi:hypothetical protein